jgi:hypothetical protein
MKFSEYIKEAEGEEVDNSAVDKVITEMIDKNWSSDEAGINEACNYMKEMAKSTHKGAKKMLKEMDDYTSKMVNESYVLGTIKPRK